MQIKRFEAADMTEALRLVKRECGENAVILSAKEVRPGGFFSALRKKSVEITAATDYPVKDGAESDDFSGVLSQQINTDTQADRVSLSASPQNFVPFSRKAERFWHQPPALETPPDQLGRTNRVQAHPVIREEVKSDLETKQNGGAGEGSKAEKIHITDGNPSIAEPFYRDHAAQQVIALVGPCGAGKTTMLAKLAWRCRVIEKKRTGLISLDRFRMGANGMLARVAHIMDLPLKVVHGAGQLRSALNDLSAVDVILVDTPGMVGNDLSMMNEIDELLRCADPDETHLVVNATVRDDVFEACVKSFFPLGVNRLLLTHMDELTGRVVAMNHLKKARLALSFFGDGVELVDGLEESMTDRSSDNATYPQHRDGQVTTFHRKRGLEKTQPPERDVNSHSVHYVANRNSELFHHPNCKSVKRINVENITAFNSIEHAMEEGFKPCRACCDIKTIRESLSGGVGYQRARAI